MKQFIFYVLATGLFFNTGCSKQEKTATQGVPSAEAVSPPVAPEVSVEREQAADTSLSEKAAAIKTLVQATGTEAVQKAQSAVTVTADDVLADLKLSTDEVKAKAAGYNQSELTAYANGYKEVITEKKSQLTSLAEKLKQLPVAEMLGGKGKDLKTQVSQYTSQLSGLKERYGVYLDLLKKYGVDLSAYGL